MFLNGFSVRIPEGREEPGGYVDMQHNQSYTLVLRNTRNERCDARVEIEGRHVGTWRIEANSNIRLERPEHDTGKFTFYKVGTPEAGSAQLERNDPNLGLVRVVFTPERKYQPVRPLPSTYWWRTWEPVDPPYQPLTPYPYTPWQISYTHTDSGDSGGGGMTNNAVSTTTTYTTPSRGRTAGGTGLSGRSGQQFGQAWGINYDYTQQTTIHLRLTCDEYEGPRPLTSTSTPIPPPVW